MVIEVQLLQAGLTLVFSDAVATPPKDGEFDLMKILEPLLAYYASGKWCQNTVAELCRNRAILGIQEIGRRSEGAHRRFGPDGPRPLNDNDRLENRKPRVIKNNPDVIVSAPMGFEPKFATDRWQDIQDQMDQRSRNQRGVRRAKAPTKYPLACRVFDLTDGCGSVMYGITSGQRRLYKCGRYQSTAGAECHHNLVDAEALLRCTLRTLTQRLDQLGSRQKLCRMFLARAEANSDKDVFLAGQSAIAAARQRVASLSEDLKIAERRMATERDDDRYQSIAYIRVSTLLQATEGVSLDAQEAKIRLWCAANDAELAGVFVDAGISGKRSDNAYGRRLAGFRSSDGRRC